MKLFVSIYNNKNNNNKYYKIIIRGRLIHFFLFADYCIDCGDCGSEPAIQHQRHERIAL